MMRFKDFYSYRRAVGTNINKNFVSEIAKKTLPKGVHAFFVLNVANVFEEAC